MCRRLILPLLPQAHHHQHQDGGQIGQHLEQLLAGAAQARDIQVQPGEEAEQVGAPDGVEGPPHGKDNQGHGQPAQGLDGALAGPGALDVVHGVVQPAQAGDPRADAGGQVLVADDVDAGGVGGGGVFAHRAEVEAHAGAVEEPAQQHS